VGGRILQLDGSLQEAGSIVWRDGTCLGYGRGRPVTAPEYMFRRDVDYCSGAFLLIRRDRYSQNGGLDPDYLPVYYEEVDLCVKFWELGCRVVFEPRATVLHYEYGSSSGLTQVHERMRDKQGVFVRKHTLLLERNYRPAGPTNPRQVLEARSHDRGRRRVLMIDDRVPHRWLGAGFPRSARIVNTLQSLGCFVTLYPMQIHQECWDDVYRAVPPETEVMLDYGPGRLLPFLADRRGYYDVVIVSREPNMKQMDRLLRQDPNLLGGARLVYDVEALWSDREITWNRVHARPASDKEAERMVREEASRTAGADHVIAVSAHDAERLHQHSGRPVTVVSHVVDSRATPKAFTERRDLLFVGPVHGEGMPNADALIWFGTEVMPRLRMRLPGVRLHVVGVNHSAAVERIAAPDLLLHGRVDDVTPFYDDARVFIAPTRYGAGIPLKVCEAAGFGVPAVTTPLLAEQLGWALGEELLVGSTPDEFAEACVRLYQDEQVWSRIRTGALARIDREYRPEQAACALLTGVGR
jgi:O-antigen biosynthesis protein